MARSQFVLCQGFSWELQLLPQILEFGLKKSNTNQLGSFKVKPAQTLQIYHVIDGKFNWMIDRQPQVLYPGDTVMVLPGQEIGGMEEHLGIGTYFWLYLKIEPIARNGRITLGKWSHLSAIESFTIGEILSRNHLSVLKIKEIPSILCEMHMEILGQEIGYLTRVHYLLDSLFIIIARHCSRLVEVHGSIPQTFTDLEQTLYLNLSHRWTVQEMAGIVGLGTTSFCEKLKHHTGYSPGLFLINIRISKAKELIKRGQTNITDIALITGFYSSQHFSTTFKRFTGNTPGEFKKKMLNLP